MEEIGQNLPHCAAVLCKDAPGRPLYHKTISPSKMLANVKLMYSYGRNWPKFTPLDLYHKTINPSKMLASVKLMYSYGRNWPKFTPYINFITP